jgi:3-isopropylmalate/(R)-2-methylmalate dehydratase small subunit
MKPFHVLTAVAAPLPYSDFVRDGAAYRHAQILVSEVNPAADPASEHAARVLAGHGIRCVISSSMPALFSTSCIRSGILPIKLADPEVRMLLDDAARPESALMTIDLPHEEIVRAGGLVLKFHVQRSVKERLLQGSMVESHRSGKESR